MIKEERNIVFNDESELREVWDEAEFGLMPEINFSNSTVVGVFYGEHEAIGYEINVIEVIEHENTTKVFYEKIIPSSGVKRPLRRWPCHILKTEKIDKPLVFIENIEYCKNNSDCVPASCCHAIKCINAQYRPDCIDTGCTDVCEPYTMDCCSYCGCKCAGNKCIAVLNNATFN
jgi:hypothetical protein